MEMIGISKMWLMEDQGMLQMERISYKIVIEIKLQQKTSRDFSAPLIQYGYVSIAQYIE